VGPNFEEVGDAALAMANVLLPQWLGGKRQGHEWIGETRANGGLGNSWCINLTTGAWLHGAGDERGGDMVSLYAALNHLNQKAALKEVALQVGVTNRPVRVLERTQPTEAPVEPIPLGAPEPIDDPVLGKPVLISRYGSAFWVLRFEKDGKKTFRPMTWRRGKWARKGYPAPRPLYNLAGLAANPEAPVLLVEGEKSADAAAKVMGAYVVMTWASGSSAVHQNDWSPLKGRDVLVWPDADDPGAKAAAEIAGELAKLEAKRVRVITVDDHADGWDAADAIAEGWDTKRIAAWAKPRIRVTWPAEAVVEPVPAETPAAETQLPAVTRDAPVLDEGEVVDSAVVNWKTLGLDCNEGGMPHATIANVSTIIQAHPKLQGRIWYDSFTDQVTTTMHGCAARRWTDADDLNLTVFIQQSLRLNKVKMDMVGAGVTHAARRASRNSLTNYLDGLEWDGVQRLETWLADCLGCEHNEYSMAIAVNWPISMVARAYVPGSKVDTMPVLEGAQGMAKSTFLEVLGAPWYGSIPVAFGDKDFLQAIQGRWLVEIPDMTGFSKREHTHILATITIRSDIYRPSYGRHTEEHPRVAVFAATSETDDYLQDARGRRRYWPLRCTDIDIDALHQQRDQVFAEARVRYRAGAKWYEMPGSADDEQSARAAPDLWTDKVIDYVNEMHQAARFNRTPIYITSSRILSDAIELTIAKQGDIEKRRIARIMRENGWVQKRDAYTRHWKKLERPKDGPPADPPPEV
jgi:putative DNA primase/helicase